MNVLFLQALAAGTKASEANLSSLTFMAPIFAFLFVVVVMFAILKKTELLGDEDWTNVFVSLFIGVLFVSIASTRKILISIIPWFAIILTCIFFIMILTSLMGNTKDIVSKRLGWFFVIVLLVIVFFIAINTLSGPIMYYLPGPLFGFGGDPEVLFFLSWFYKSELFSTLLLVLSAGVVCWVLVRKK